MEFLVKELLGLPLLRGVLLCPWLSRAIFACISHLRSFLHEYLCLYPLSDEFGQARWSQRISVLSLSNGIAIELRERSLRQASPFRDKARHLADSASIGACHRPTLGLGPMSGFLRSCLRCCLCWRGDQLLLASRRGGHEASVLSTESQSALSLERGGSTAGLSEFGDSDSLFSSSATQEDPQSSAALGCNS